MRGSLRTLGSIAMLLAALALAGCGGGTRYPLLSPVEQARSYGYSEQSLGADRYTVSYLGPSKLSSSAPAARDRDIEAARSQALDLATWRAALIADGAGFAGFRITDQRSSVDQSTQPVYYDTQFYQPYGGNVGAGGMVRPPSVGTTAPQTFPEAPYNRLQGRASIDVQLLRNPGPNDLVAKDVIRQLRLKYPEAEQG
ncbi:MAG TPA: hypothetical protein VMU06_22155 [Stellaceae bacterium]|nr:hypothetical protein [Stellaceae bacterium]